MDLDIATRFPAMAHALTRAIMGSVGCARDGIRLAAATAPSVCADVVLVDRDQENLVHELGWCAARRLTTDDLSVLAMLGRSSSCWGREVVCPF